MFPPGTLIIFQYAQLGGTAAAVFFQLTSVRFNRLTGNQFSFGYPAAGANRLLRRAGAALSPAAELLFYQPVLQAVERDDAEPPAGGQAAENRLHPLVQGIQFPIDGNPHCLEAAAGRVLVFAALGRRHSGCNQVRKLQGRQNRGFLPCFHDFTRNLPGIRFLTIIAQDAGSVSLTWLP